MERRTALKIITLGTMVTPPDPSGKACVCPMEAGTNAAKNLAKGDQTLRFFSQSEAVMLDELMEMIIPADHHSPGARAAQVSLFADLMVATSDETMQAHWRQGLRLMAEVAAKSSLAEALAMASANEDSPQSELEKFFVTLKEMTVNGYYTSAIGIHQDLQYGGNTYLLSFPGCTHHDH
jgi:hypothetical protein